MQLRPQRCVQSTHWVGNDSCLLGSNMAPACCGWVLEHPRRSLLYLFKYSSINPVHRYHLYIPTVFLKTALALQLHPRWDSDVLRAE